eukprot:TRINITY_DN6912_c0_g2_i3.p1 TRINITY_DN6912_c0_g2~~TRINITY_DN6912_c0_g2_i3.p1  ORF type:complete len:121 (+),score=10.38 TRINITY_DN6912_c0_g2_i3:695-1057(+)
MNKIASEWHSKGLQGFIRSWSYDPQSETMTYHVANNRFCKRIGREHKSNHIMFQVDIKKGCYSQRCLDPECRGWESVPKLLPQHVRAQVGSNIDDVIEEVVEKPKKIATYSVCVMPTNKK